MIALLMSLTNKRKKRLIGLSNPRKTIIKLSLWLGLIFFLHISAMMVLEGMSLKDAVWVTFATITTIGYGDVSAKTWPGRLATMGLLGMGGIFILADTASKLLLYRSYALEQKLSGTWRWKKMTQHIVIIGTPDVHGEQFFNRICHDLRAVPEFNDLHIILLTETFKGQKISNTLSGMNVVHYNGNGVTDEELRAVNIDQARHVIVIADRDTDPSSDCTSLDILGRLHDLGFKGTSVVECVNDQNRSRARRLGADAVIRPARGYPEMLVRALIAPGSEVILENFFNSKGDEVFRIELDHEINQTWRDVMFSVIGAGIGIPVGYLDQNHEVVTNPSPSVQVNSKVMFVIVGDGQKHPALAISKALSSVYEPYAA